MPIRFTAIQPTDIIPMKSTLKRQALFVFALLLFGSGRCFSQMRQVYLDGVAENEIYKTSFYSASEGFVATGLVTQPTAAEPSAGNTLRWPTLIIPVIQSTSLSDLQSTV
jgi:hypothetical protein